MRLRSDRGVIRCRNRGAVGGLHSRGGTQLRGFLPADVGGAGVDSWGTQGAADQA